VHLPFANIYSEIYTLRAHYASEIHIFFNSLEISDMCLVMLLLFDSKIVKCLTTEENSTECAVVCRINKAKISEI
jgi:hypothetical protein